MFFHYKYQRLILATIYGLLFHSAWDQSFLQSVSFAFASEAASLHSHSGFGRLWPAVDRLVQLGRTPLRKHTVAVMELIIRRATKFLSPALTAACKAGSAPGNVTQQ